MNLMLLAIAVSVGLGLVASRIGRREQVGLAVLATLMTALYFFFPWKFV